MNPNELRQRLLTASGTSRQRHALAERVIGYLHFVANDMVDKRELRRRYHRNTIRAYRNHLEMAGIAPIDTFERLYWLVCQLDVPVPQTLCASARLLWVLADDRHRTVSHASEGVLRLINEYGETLMVDAETVVTVADQRSSEGRAA